MHTDTQVQACMATNPQHRPTALQLLNHPFYLRAKNTGGLASELKAYLKLHKQKLFGISSGED